MPLLEQNHFRFLTRPSWWALLAASLVVRVVSTLSTLVGRDEEAILRHAYTWLETGRLPLTGAEIVYTGSRIPGALLNVLVGTPLWISGGEPIAVGITLSLWNFLAAVFLILFLARLFPQAFDRHGLGLSAWILLAPWPVFFTNLWNPSWLPVFSVLFFASLFIGLSKPKSFPANFLLAALIPMIFQIHLSVVLLACTGLIALSFSPRVNFAALVSGTIFGLIGLLPQWLGFSEVRATSGSLGNNLVFKPEHLIELPKLLLRQWTFATGETHRFFGTGGGLLNGVKTVFENPYLIPTYLVLLAGTLILLIASIQFSWAYLFKQLPPDPVLSKWDRLVFWTPLIGALTYCFSVKGPSAHTFWILMPLSFYPFLRVLDLKSQQKVARLFLLRPPVMIFYSLCALFTTICGYTLVREGTTVWSWQF